MPVNALIIRALINLYSFYGDDFKVQCPSRTGPYLTLYEVAREIVRRLSSTFLRDADGKRAVYGGTGKFHHDPHWRDLILFYEYFHGDNGAGIGASHQTGWTGLIAPLLDVFARADAQDLLELERERTSGFQLSRPDVMAGLLGYAKAFNARVDDQSGRVRDSTQSWSHA
jgi:hypothetical protein